MRALCAATRHVYQLPTVLQADVCCVLPGRVGPCCATSCVDQPVLSRTHKNLNAACFPLSLTHMQEADAVHTFAERWGFDIVRDAPAHGHRMEYGAVAEAAQ